MDILSTFVVQPATTNLHDHKFHMKHMGSPKSLLISLLTLMKSILKVFKNVFFLSGHQHWL